jgi:hypothetical protein
MGRSGILGEPIQCLVTIHVMTNDQKALMYLGGV